MAYIDKIYGSLAQWLELRKYLRKTRPEYIRFMYPRPDEPLCREYPISNFNEEANIFLLNNCHLQFVVNRIKEQYSEAWYKKHKINKKAKL
jgi:hypothetical protein